MSNKRNKKHFKSTLKRVAQVQELVRLHYEPGRQDRCRRWVWRTKVYPLYGISEKTFYEYLRVDIEKVSIAREDERQTRIEF